VELKVFDGLQYVVLADDGTFPNSRIPVVVFPGALAGRHAGASLESRARAFELLFAGNSWPPAWRDGVFGYHHYHSTAHEALGIAAGSMVVQLGGDAGLSVDAKAGDCIVIPAGVAHRRLESSADLLIVGAYPRGQSPDMLYGKPGERPGADDRIAAVGLPGQDPVSGSDGPLLALWRRS
jgi:uncharacterized protein YjlB